MRRRVQIMLLVLLALVAGGWGTLAAAMLCPHANVNAAQTGARPSEAQGLCHTQPVVEKQAHCHDAGMGAQSTGDAEMDAGDAGHAADALGQHLSNCAHCLSRPELPAPTNLTRQKLQPKSGVEIIATSVRSMVEPATAFTRPVLYRQGAPPGPYTPLHLLNRVILI